MDHLIKINIAAALLATLLAVGAAVATWRRLDRLYADREAYC